MSEAKVGNLLSLVSWLRASLPVQQKRGNLVMAFQPPDPGPVP